MATGALTDEGVPDIPTLCKMSPATVARLLRAMFKTVPSFDGDPRYLSSFIEACDHVRKWFRSDNPILVTVLKHNVLEKLTGEALNLIRPRSDLVSWETIREVLMQKFAERLELDVILQKLQTTWRGRDESVADWGERIWNLRMLIFGIVSNDGRQPMWAVYERLCLKTFILGLEPRVREAVRQRSAPTLERAIALATEEENVLDIIDRIRPLYFDASSYRADPAVVDGTPRRTYSGLNWWNTVTCSQQVSEETFRTLHRRQSPRYLRVRRQRRKDRRLEGLTRQLRAFDPFSRVLPESRTHRLSTRRRL